MIDFDRHAASCIHVTSWQPYWCIGEGGGGVGIQLARDKVCHLTSPEKCVKCLVYIKSKTTQSNAKKEKSM